MLRRADGWKSSYGRGPETQGAMHGRNWQSRIPTRVYRTSDPTTTTELCVALSKSLNLSGTSVSSSRTRTSAYSPGTGLRARVGRPAGR